MKNWQHHNDPKFNNYNLACPTYKFAHSNYFSFLACSFSFFIFSNFLLLPLYLFLFVAVQIICCSCLDDTRMLTNLKISQLTICLIWKLFDILCHSKFTIKILLMLFNVVLCFITHHPHYGDFLFDEQCGPQVNELLWWQKYSNSSPTSWMTFSFFPVIEFPLLMDW